MENEIKIPRMEGIPCAAVTSGLTVHAMRVLVANGDVVSIRVGRKILVNLDSVAEFLKTGIPQGRAVGNISSRSTESNAPRISPIPLR